MKKVVRTVWIGLLSSLAFLVACTCHKGLTRAEKKQLKTERAELIERINEQSTYSSEDPKVMYEMKRDEMDLRQRLNEIDQQLGNEQSLVENNKMISTVASEMDSLQAVIEASNKPKPCVYGPPPTRPKSSQQ